MTCMPPQPLLLRHLVTKHCWQLCSKKMAVATGDDRVPQLLQATLLLVNGQRHDGHLRCDIYVATPMLQDLCKQSWPHKAHKAWEMQLS